ncbi:hypothetical protein NUBL17190_20750 [Klebsiella pneumoniae]|nr:hypothetical protein NUBL22006_09950 [Klebsiella pneumoniae]GKN93576.1 hypothetical protein NUBL17190_20750 [Klebsiella pneumoniae]
MVIGSRCGRRAAADVQGTGGKQEQGKSKQSAAEEMCSHWYCPCKKKGPDIRSGP